MQHAGSGRTYAVYFLEGCIAAVAGMVAFYYILLSATTGDAMYAIGQFDRNQPWMTLLILGFGVQMGLYRIIRKGFRISVGDQSDARFAAGTGTAVSGIAMVACCAHHAVDVLPIVGLSAAAMFLTAYQTQLLIFGVLTNSAGIVLMLWFAAGKAQTADDRGVRI